MINFLKKGIRLTIYNKKKLFRYIEKKYFTLNVGRVETIPTIRVKPRNRLTTVLSAFFM